LLQPCCLCFCMRPSGTPLPLTELFLFLNGFQSLVSTDTLPALRQLVGSMCIPVDKLRYWYGVLTKYESFWVVELCEDRSILITDLFEWSSCRCCLPHPLHELEDSKPFINLPAY
jgi:hypothetical protein